MCRNTFKFFWFSCNIQTIFLLGTERWAVYYLPHPIDFLIKKFKNKSCVLVFFSYRTKCESPAGDQFWKFSHQRSIFGCIGNQWVAISSPGITTQKCLDNPRSSVKSLSSVLAWFPHWHHCSPTQIPLGTFVNTEITCLNANRNSGTLSGNIFFALK